MDRENSREYDDCITIQNDDLIDRYQDYYKKSELVEYEFFKHFHTKRKHIRDCDTDDKLMSV